MVNGASITVIDRDGGRCVIVDLTVGKMISMTFHTSCTAENATIEVFYLDGDERKGIPYTLSDGGICMGCENVDGFHLKHRIEFEMPDRFVFVRAKFIEKWVPVHVVRSIQ